MAARSTHRAHHEAYDYKHGQDHDKRDWMCGGHEHATRLGFGCAVEPSTRSAPLSR